MEEDTSLALWSCKGMYTPYRLSNNKLSYSFFRKYGGGHKPSAVRL